MTSLECLLAGSETENMQLIKHNELQMGRPSTK